MAAVTVGAIPLLQAMDLLGMAVLAGLVATAAGGPRDSRLRRYHPDTQRARLGGLQLERVAGLNSVAGKPGLLLGAPLAGVLLAVVDPATVLFINAATFAAAGVLIGVLVPSRRSPRPNPRTGPHHRSTSPNSPKACVSSGPTRFFSP